MKCALMSSAFALSQTKKHLLLLLSGLPLTAVPEATAPNDCVPSASVLSGTDVDDGDAAGLTKNGQGELIRVSMPGAWYMPEFDLDLMSVSQMCERAKLPHRPSGRRSHPGHRAGRPRRCQDPRVHVQSVLVR